MKTNLLSCAILLLALSATGLAQTCNQNNTLTVSSQCFTSLASAYAAATTGQTIVVAAGWTETWTANLTMNKLHVGFQFLGGCSINQGSFQLLVTANGGSFIYGPPDGASCTFTYSGTASAHQFGSPSATSGVNIFQGSNYGVNISGTGAVGIDGYCLGNSIFTNVGVGGNGASSNQIGWRIGHCSATGENDSAGNVFNHTVAVSTLIGVQENGNELEFYNNLFTFGADAAGTIAVDIESNGSEEGSNADYFVGGSVFGYRQPFKCNDCLNTYASLETESNSGQPDVSFGAHSGGNEFILGGSVPKSVSGGTNQNNIVRQLGTQNCLLGCTQHTSVNSCVTPSGANSACNTTLTWPHAWSDTSYTTVCTLAGNISGGSVMIDGVVNTLTTSTIEIQNAGANASASQWGINCIGMR